MDTSARPKLTRGLLALTTGGLLATSTALVGMAPAHAAAAAYEVRVEPGTTPGSGQFVSYCNTYFGGEVLPCESTGKALNKDLAHRTELRTSGNLTYIVDVYSYQCLAPGTVGHFTSKNHLMTQAASDATPVPNNGVLPAACGNPSAFVDLATTQQFYTEMAWLSERGISTGWADGTYRALQPINRDAMAAFLFRLAGDPSYVAPAKSPFTDVSATQQYYREMAWLAEQGISTGWDNGDGTRSYQPLSPINRDAMAAFLYRLAGKPEFTAPATSPFQDVSTQQDFYQEMSWLADKQISTGWVAQDGTRTYQPLSPINRDAMAAFIYRYAHTIK